MYTFKTELLPLIGKSARASFETEFMHSYIEKGKLDSDSFSLFVVKDSIRSLYREDNKSKMCCTY